MSATPPSPRSQLAELEATVSSNDDISSFFALLPVRLVSPSSASFPPPPSSSSSSATPSLFAFPLSHFASLPSVAAAVRSLAGTTKARPHQHHTIPASATNPQLQPSTATSPSADNSSSSPLLSPNTAEPTCTPTVLSVVHPSPSSLPPLPQTSDSPVTSPATATTAVTTPPPSTSPYKHQPYAERTPKPATAAGPAKPSYNRSYVRGFARPPPPPQLTTSDPTTTTPDTADPSTALPPLPVTPEDDPTSNHYLPPIYRQPLSLSQLMDICSDPMILSSLPTPGVHVTRLTAQGKLREYVMYRCAVCGREVGDKSKHKKHEASCKKRILRMLSTAEKDEEDQKNGVVVAGDGSGGVSGGGLQVVEQSDNVKEEKRKKKAVAAPSNGAELSASSQSEDAKEAAESTSSRWKPARAPIIEKTESYKQELKKQLKWIWHTMDVNPATCLLSRDSVLVRMDLVQIFTEGASGDDVFNLLTDAELDCLLAYLPSTDQAAARGESAAVDGVSVKQEFPPPRMASVLSTLRSTLSSPAFVQSLDEYKRILMNGSLDPALKGLRMMASARRRRQQRDASQPPPDKKPVAVEQEVYWGEVLSEVKVNAPNQGSGKNGRSLMAGWRGLLGKRHKAVPAGPSNAMNGHVEGEGKGGSGDDEKQDDDERTLNGENERDDGSDVTASDTDIDVRASEGSDAEQQQTSDEDEDEEENSDRETALHRKHKEKPVRRPLHKTRRRPTPSTAKPIKRKQQRNTSRSSASARQRRQSISDSSAISTPTHSPLHIDTLLPLPLQLKLPPPLPAAGSLPDVPAVQRFHMRSPRFRRVRYARFVLKDGNKSLIDTRTTITAVTTSLSPSHSTTASPSKQRSSKRDSSPALNAFSHLPRSTAKQCVQLQRRMMSSSDKQAALQRIMAARSVRVKQVEQERLNAALHAETQMLQLMETAASETAHSKRRKRDWRARDREEKQQRMRHGMKRPRGFYDNENEDSKQSMMTSSDEEREGAADDDEADDSHQQQRQQADMDEEQGADEVMRAGDDDNGSSADMDATGDDERHAHSHPVGNNGTQHDDATLQSGQETEEEEEEGAESEQNQSTVDKPSTFFYTPVMTRSKFGFSTFLKQITSSEV